MLEMHIFSSRMSEYKCEIKSVILHLHGKCGDLWHKANRPTGIITTIVIQHRILSVPFLHRIMSPSFLSCFNGVIIYLQVIRPWGQVLDLFYWLWNGNIYDDSILWPECSACVSLVSMWTDLRSLWTDRKVIQLDFSVFVSHSFSIHVSVSTVLRLPWCLWVCIWSRLVVLMFVFVFFFVSSFRVSQGTRCLLLHLSLMDLLHPHWKRGKWVTVHPTFPSIYPPLVVTSSPERYGSAQGWKTWKESNDCTCCCGLDLNCKTGHSQLNALRFQQEMCW